MAQGWSIDPTADKIKFIEAPPAPSGSPPPATNINVKELPSGGFGGTDVWALGAWCPAFGYPSVVEFFADRLFFANTPTDPQLTHASNTGDYYNFGRSSPIVDSDAFSFAINARQVNAVRSLIPLDSLLILTGDGEYKLTSSNGEVIAPNTIGVKNQGNSGSGKIPPLVIGESSIFVQEEGQKVRDLGYRFEKDGFRGVEFSVWAEHLFTGYRVNWMDYWKAPWSVLLFVRNDGVMPGCTYMPEQEVVGWHWHDTQGKFIDVCSVPNVEESDVYFIVQRVVGGETVQCIEQMASTRMQTEEDAFFVDCGLSYDGRNVQGGIIKDPRMVRLTSPASTWDEDSELELLVSTGLFVGEDDIGDGFELYRDVIDGYDDEGDAQITRHSVRVVITSVVDAYTAKVRSIGTVPVPLRAVDLATWTLQRDTIDNLWHLEGCRVRVLVDGGAAGPYTVESGKVRLDNPGGVVHVGRRFVAEVETLELNDPGMPGMRDQNKLAHKVTVLLRDTKGIEAGTADGPIYPVKARDFENLGELTKLVTGVLEHHIPSGWGENAGRIRITSSDPLPMEILGITTRAVSSNQL